MKLSDKFANWSERKYEDKEYKNDKCNKVVIENVPATRNKRNKCKTEKTQTSGNKGNKWNKGDSEIDGSDKSIKSTGTRGN